MQKSCVERVHRTLMGKARAMRSDTPVPVNCWDEFILTTCYLTNCTPVKSQQGHTPYEQWFGCLPDLSHPHEIGCRVFVLVQNHHNPKVFDHSIECVLIGYFPDSKSYCCYHHPSGKVFTSFHVSFSLSRTNPPPQPCQRNPLWPAFPNPPHHPHLLSHPNLPLSMAPLHSLTAPHRCPARLRKRLWPLVCHMYIPAIQYAILAAIAAAHSHLELPESPTAAINPYEPPMTPNDDDDSWFTGAASNSGLTDPATYHEAMASPHATEWTKALQEEFQSLKDLGVYKLVPQSSVPSGRHIIFKLKHNEHGNPTHFKA